MSAKSGALPGKDRPGAGAKNRWTVLTTCCMSLFIIGLDVTGMNVALPSIRTALHASQSHLQWILDAYTLVLASLLMVSGSIADRVGRKKTFIVGLGVFGLGSILCGIATTVGFLVTARMLQAVGGSMMNPVAMSIITNTFTDRAERAQAIGLWGATIGVSMALGPLVGGFLVQAFDWQAIFWLNIPVVTAALLLTWFIVPESRAPTPRSLDPAGQVLVALCLGTLTYAVIQGRTDGWTSPIMFLSFGVSALSAFAFLIVEQRVDQPMVDPRFFTSIPFSAANTAAILGFAGMSGFLLINTLYLQSTRSMSPVHAGLATLPMAVMSAAFAPLSGKLTGSRGPRLPLTLSGVATAVAAAGLTRITTTTPLWQLLTTYSLFGLGNGLLNAPISYTAVSGMPRAQAGVAASIASTSRQIGTALGVAIFGTIVFARMSGMSTLPTASHPAWWLLAADGLVISALGILVGFPGAQRSADRIAHQFGVDS